MCQNDAHLFVRPDQIKDEVGKVLKLIQEVYIKDFGFSPELNIDFYEAEGEAAFYGPKIDIQIKTALNHDVTIPTCQLDFALPERFELEYVGEDGEKHRPVVIHRAILGSSDRFISFLLEDTKFVKHNFKKFLIC